MNIIKCENSMEGILTAIYESYEWKLNPDETKIEMIEENYSLFSTYYTSNPSTEKTRKVERTLIRDFGGRFYYDVGLALSSENSQKAQAVYQTVALGLTLEQKGTVMEHMANPWVMMMYKLSLNAAREEDHLRGFLRFEELENGILFAKIGPKNNVIGYLAEHFSDRLPSENFVIYDDRRNIFTIHPKKEKWYYVMNQEHFDDSLWERTEEEKEYQKLFQTFCKHISIKERENLALQRNMLPLRFRQYMTEFKEVNC